MTSPFLLFPALLALETIGATAYVILRSINKLNTWMVWVIGMILFELADRYITNVTGYLYLKSLAT
jgi:uncharacterized membrane protein YecN with MAPEG domain